MRATSRAKLGKNFTEGARRLWLEMQSRNWEQTELADFLGASLPTLHSWLYGDNVPQIKSLRTIEQKLGIDAMLFSQSPARKFVLPSVAA